ncbi:MAG: hypothetical protein JJU31_16320 [Wenzhouxiangella sp.]|nr:hypothetical protein [Wenzhouxiangella sp.]
MKSTARILASLAVLLLATDAVAHNPLEHPDWCSDGARLVVVDEFAWTGEELRIRGREADEAVLDQREKGDSCPAGGDSSLPAGSRICGQFDDDWLQAFRLASSHCKQFAVSYPNAGNQDYGTVVMIATAPEEFLDDDHHHELYDLALGLSGACVRCEPERRRTATPAAHSH